MEHGEPDVYGVWKYFVREDKTFVCDWRQIVDLERERPVHRYCRFERFEAILHHLCGGGWVAEEIVEEVMEQVEDWDESRVWLNVQKCLRGMGMRRHYNRIPYILGQMGLGEVMNRKPCGLVLEKFSQMSQKFDRIKHGLTRIYFPCLRYVAIRLLDMYGADFRIFVPIVKTPCKVAVMSEIFNILCDPYGNQVVTSK